MTTLSSIAPALANHLWQSTAFAAVAWLATLLLRRNQARVRYGLWLAASVKFLVPFSLLIALGSLLPKPQHAVVAMPIYSTVDTVALPFSSTETAVAPAVFHPSRMQVFKQALPSLLVLAWVCGVVAVLTVWCLRWRQVARALRRATRVESGREVEILRQMETALSRNSHIPLLLSAELMEPGIFGLFHPVLIRPERLSQRLDDEHN